MKKYIIIICIFTGIVSCKKNYLDRFPQSAISPQLFFKTQNDLDLYVNGLLSLPGSDGIYVNTNDATTDDYGNISTFTLAAVMQGTINATMFPITGCGAGSEILIISSIIIKLLPFLMMLKIIMQAWQGFTGLNST